MRMTHVLLTAILALPVRVEAESLEVSQADHEDWIYTVPSGHVECVDDALLFRSGNTSYALNTVALQRGYDPPLALVPEAHFVDAQFAQYLVRWKREWESGKPSARTTYGPALVDATAPRSLRDAALTLCD